jgi:hypothetical protein
MLVAQKMVLQVARRDIGQLTDFGRNPGRRVTGLLLRLRLDFRAGAGQVPPGRVVASGSLEGAPGDGEGLRDVDGVNRHQDPHRYEVPAAPALRFDVRVGHGRVLLLGEAAFQVGAGMQP